MLTPAAVAAAAAATLHVSNDGRILRALGEGDRNLSYRNLPVRLVPPLREPPTRPDCPDLQV